MSAAALLSADDAAFRYPQHRQAVGPFTLAARPGELHLVCGPSGSGKSTLARLLAGVIPHLYRGELSGRVHIDGRASDEVPLWQLSERVGLVTQNPAAQLLGSSVRAELAFGLEGLGLAAAQRAARLAWALDAFDLAPLAARDPHTLSGGEQQRVVLAAIAARRPAALVLDEPLSMLDAAAARAVVDHLDALRRDGTAVVVAEHRRRPFAHLADVRRTELPAHAAESEALPEPPERVPPLRLVAERLRVGRGGRAVLDGVELGLAGGELVSVVGPNGAGKTTLLRALAGLQRHAGRIDGVVGGAPGRPRLAMCFQNPDRQLFNPSVRDELRFATPAADAGRCARVAALLGLAAYLDTPPLLLSEGEKKRLGVAIMLMQPGLHGLCLDEPTLGQDGANRRRLGRLARRLAAAGYLCVAATHDLDWARTWSDRVVVMQHGRITAVETPPAARAAGAALQEASPCAG